MPTINELEERVEAKLAYGVKCTRDMNELARMKDAARSPLERMARRVGFVALCVLAYAPIVAPFVFFFVGG